MNDELLESLLREVAEAPALDVEPTPESFGPFRLEEELGRGGMGVVFRARDVRLDREVALKLLSAGRASERALRARLEHEARALARINHPRIATVFETGEIDGRHFIALELAVGPTLRRRLCKGRFDAAGRWEAALQITSGLAAAHAEGVVHGDLKPENIVLGPRGVKIFDFGLATFLSAAAEGAAPAGTPAYMAPEQRAGASASLRSDVYALGLVLKELWADEPLPRRAHAVVMRCLMTEPSQRYEDAAQVLEALEIARGRRRWRRRGLLLAAVVALLGVVASTWRGEAPLPVLDRPVRVTAQSAEVRVHSGQLDPTGRWLVYQSGLDVYLQDLASGSTRRLERPEGLQRLSGVAFVDDARALVGVVVRESGAALERYDLESNRWSTLRPLDRGDVLEDVHPGGGLAIVRYDPEAHTHALLVAESLRGSLVRIAETKPGEIVTGSRWSEDGAELVYERMKLDASGVSARIERIGVGGEAAAAEVVYASPRLVQESAAAGLTWLGKDRLLWTENEPGHPPSTRMMVSERDGDGVWSRPRLVERFAGSSITDLRAARDGHSLLYLETRTQTDVLALPLDGAGHTPRALTQTDDNERSSGVLPDGRLLLVSDRTRSYDVLARPLDGVGERLVDDVAQETWSDATRRDLLFWRFDGRKLDLVARPIGASGRSEERELVSSPYTGLGFGRPPPLERHFRCGADSDVCLYATIAEEQVEFRRLDPESGLASAPAFSVEHTSANHLGWDLDPTGEQVTIPTRGSSISRLTVDGRLLERVEGVPECVYRSAVSHAEAFIGFATCSSEPLFRIHRLRDGEVEQLHAANFVWFGHPEISSGGHELVFTAKYRDADLWVASMVDR